MRNVHPIHILKRLWGFWFVALLPFIQGIFSGNLDFTLYNTAPIILVFLYAILEWRCFRYVFNKEEIIVEKGVVFKRRVILSKKNISTIDIDYGFFLWILRCAVVRIDTESGNLKNSVIQFVVRKKDLPLITDYMYTGKINWRYHAKLYKIALASPVFTRSGPGIFLLASLITTSGKFLGQKFEETLVDTIAIPQKILGQYIPPAFAVIAYILLIGWLINFVLLLLRQSNFRLARKGHCLILKKGFIIHRQTIINIRMINARTIRQTPLMKLLGLYQMIIYTAGYGKEKDEMSILIPADSKSIIERVEKLLPEIKSYPISVRTNKKAGFRYILTPGIWLGILTLACIITSVIFKKHIILVILLFILPILYLTILCIMRFNAHDKVGFSKNFLTATSFNGLSVLHTSILPTALREVSINQNPFQLYDGLCNIYISARDESKHRVIVRHFDVDDIKRLDGMTNLKFIRLKK